MVVVLLRGEKTAATREKTAATLARALVVNLVSRLGLRALRALCSIPGLQTIHQCRERLKDSKTKELSVPSLKSAAL